MEYNKNIVLKDGRICVLRAGGKEDGKEVFTVFNQTHDETDFLLTYPDENSFVPDKEAEFLENKKNSADEIELLAFIDGKLVGTAGISKVGSKDKVKHRAELGISILKEHWGLGIGKAMMEGCIECAKTAGYAQLELDVVANNEKAMSLYQKYGFIEFGRNPKGFKSRYSGYQELVYMRLEL